MGIKLIDGYIEIVKKLGFEYGFGQHSGVMDKTKNKYELPRFPINEKYGEEKRFKTLLNTIPFPYLKILPEEKYLKPKNNLKRPKTSLNRPLKQF